MEIELIFSQIGRYFQTISIFCSALTCANVLCAENRVCVECEPNECNTYTCDNPDGNGKSCAEVCLNPGPRCICKPYTHEVNNRCVPLVCNKLALIYPSDIPIEIIPSI